MAMRFTPEHMITVPAVPGIRWVVRELGALTTLQWEEAWTAADTLPTDSDKVRRRVELASEYLGAVLVSVTGTDPGDADVQRGPFEPTWAAETLTIQALFALLTEARSAGLPKAQPSPIGDATPT